MKFKFLLERYMFIVIVHPLYHRQKSTEIMNWSNEKFHLRENRTDKLYM